MAETVAVTLCGGVDEAADLAAWMDAEVDLRGCVRLEPRPMPEGALGAELQQLAVSLGSSGVATAMASVLIAWLRRRTGTVSLRVSRPDGSAIELHAEHVRGLDIAAIQAQVELVARSIGPGGADETAGDGANGGVSNDGD